MEASWKRFDTSPYLPDLIHRPGYEWPGDMEGRVLLAIARLGQINGKPHRLIEHMDRRWSRMVNPMGYFGDVLPNGTADEQQLSSHGWVLRGLCRMYDLTGEDRWIGRATAVVQGLTQNLDRAIVDYPINGRETTVSGHHSGIRVARCGQWVLSTDVGCAFIFLDGLTDYLRLCPDHPVRGTVELMIARFLEMDPVSINAQTHATLTACRSLLRMARVCGRDDLVQPVSDIFRMYGAFGMTATYQNQNWFGRPTWTEPCAIVDSLKVALELWRRTGDPNYLENAQKIWHTGLGHAQRCNGGFGCDSCVGPDGDWIRNSIAEASWCCTMRGAVAIADMVENAVSVNNRNVRFNIFESTRSRMKWEDGAVDISAEFGRPTEGKLLITAGKSSTRRKLHWSVFVPSWASGHAVKINGKPVPCKTEDSYASWSWCPKAGDQVLVTWRCAWKFRPLTEFGRPDSGVVEWGPFVMGGGDTSGQDTMHLGRSCRLSADDQHGLTDETTGVRLCPLDDMLDRPMPDQTYGRRVVYPSGR
jgi:uncharacterized protein